MSLLTTEVAALVGRRVRYDAPEELGRAAIRYFALAVGDDNPLYTDQEFARAHGRDDVTAPPTLICETNQYAGLGMDAEGYAGHSWRLDIPGTRPVRGGNSYVFHRPVRPEDRIAATWEITDVVEKSTGAGLPMLVITSRATYENQDDELLCTNEETLIFVALEAR